MKSHLVFGLVGLIVGVSFAENLWGAISGACLGVLFSNWNTSRVQLGALRESIAALEARQAGMSPRPDNGPAPSETDEEVLPTVASIATPAPEPNAPQEPAPESSSLENAVSAAFSKRSDVAESLGPATIAPPPRVGPSGIERMTSALRSFLLGGNTIVRIGLLVLLVGLTLLAKYAADNSLFPIEARLGFAALVGLGLATFGFRQRSVRPGFGMSLQGGGIAALYLVTFFAFKFYGLLPAGLAFGLFVALAISTAVLSVLQRSEPLLVIGSLGGFLAPVLASTGAGDHVALFSYYLLLNTSIAFVAWRQTWRVPALVAFICTYGVASTWGVLRYQPEIFASTEPFVLAFLALFTSIAVLHAWHRPPRLRGVVDGTLVFGTPFISILIQGALVRNRELGLALSAAGFGLFYAGCSIFIWRVAARELRPLAEAFIALAVGFATMAIPFAFDEALTTSIAWALEGAGLYWIGTRQSRGFPRAAGLLLQLLAGSAFLMSVVLENVDSSAFIPIANGRALSCLALAIAGIFIARQAFVSRGTLRPIEMRIAQWLGVWGLIWWTAGSFSEIEQFVATDYRLTASLLWLAATGITLEFGSERFDWDPGRSLALISLPVAAILWFLSRDAVPHLLAYGGWLAWPLVFATLYILWERMGSAEHRWDTRFRAGSLWLLAIVSAYALAGPVGIRFELANDWQLAAFGLGLAGVLIGCCWLHEHGHIPFDRIPESSVTTALGPIAAFALLTIVGIQLAARGDATPLPHIPLMNPIDLVVWLLALSIWKWWKRIDSVIGDAITAPSRRLMAFTALAAAFTSLNGLLARAVHQWANVPFLADALWDSSAMQVTLSITWTLVGMVGMLISSRQGWRGAWMGFAALLAVVVFKLFTVDLSQLSTLTRIGTFLAVGALLLVLGYVSPVPPSGDTIRKGTTGPAPLGDPS